jgi:hypothetical protein
MDIEDLKQYNGQILKYICGDIQHLNEKGVTVSFPYLLLSFAGIDFLGGLGLGFRSDNSRQRSCWFIGNWMSRINPAYASPNPEDKLSQASYLYKFARSGLIHMACVQRSVNVDTSESWKKYHLQHSSTATPIVFVHPKLFADEFVKACALFLDDLYSNETKANAAIDYLHEYFRMSEEAESGFQIRDLFQELTIETANFPPTLPTGSILPPYSSGTQAPR